MNINSSIVEILETFWSRNKAKGLLAQTVYIDQVEKGIFGTDGKEKTFSGCWLLAPSEPDFYKFRCCFFIHPHVIKASELKNDTKQILGEEYRPFYAIAEFMQNAGIGVVYVVPITEDGELAFQEIKNNNFQNIRWVFFNFQDGLFVQRDPSEFFARWRGNNGRPSHGNPWDIDIRDKILNLNPKILTELLLNELFYTGFIKTTLRKPISDPYDIDAFLMSVSQKHIFPMEIKEKFPGQNSHEKFFGIDAGRIMMLLRLCLPNDANAVYLVRELNEIGNFIGWKYITLSDIIMTSSWNLQAGGLGMGGQGTQTIRLPYDYFKRFEADKISEENLRKIGNLPKDIKSVALEFSKSLSIKFND